MTATWVLLRGLVRERRHWGVFPAQLQAALPGSVIVAPDLPGNGARCRERSPATVAGMVEACRAAVQAEGMGGPVQVLALSLGAMVAAEWRARYPQEVACAVLINTSMRPFSAFYERLRWHNYGAIVRELLSGNAISREALILRLTSERHGENQQLLRQWQAWQRACPVTRANTLRQLLAAARYRAPAGGLGDCPVLVLNGARDRLVDARCSQRLAQAWGAAFRQHPAAGHDLPLDDGAWVAQQVAQWARTAVRARA
jgi:pimeloyl-ACP methyl ester carboxylesterase